MGTERPPWYRRLTDSIAAPQDDCRADGERRLTPEAVHRQRFTTTRLMPGYSVEEVDAFLDEVMAELARLIRERDEARAAGSVPSRDDVR